MKSFLHRKIYYKLHASIWQFIACEWYFSADLGEIDIQATRKI